MSRKPRRSSSSSSSSTSGSSSTSSPSSSSSSGSKTRPDTSSYTDEPQTGGWTLSLMAFATGAPPGAILVKKKRKEPSGRCSDSVACLPSKSNHCSTTQMYWVTGTRVHPDDVASWVDGQAPEAPSPQPAMPPDGPNMPPDGPNMPHNPTHHQASYPMPSSAGAGPGYPSGATRVRRPIPSVAQPHGAATASHHAAPAIPHPSYASRSSVRGHAYGARPQPYRPPPT